MDENKQRHLKICPQCKNLNEFSAEMCDSCMYIFDLNQDSKQSAENTRNTDFAQIEKEPKKRFSILLVLTVTNKLVTLMLNLLLLFLIVTVYYNNMEYLNNIFNSFRYIGIEHYNRDPDNIIYNNKKRNANNTSITVRPYVKPQEYKVPQSLPEYRPNYNPDVTRIQVPGGLSPQVLPNQNNSNNDKRNSTYNDVGDCGHKVFLTYSNGISKTYTCRFGHSYTFNATIPYTLRLK